MPVDLRWVWDLKTHCTCFVAWLKYIWNVYNLSTLELGKCQSLTWLLLWPHARHSWQMSKFRQTQAGTLDTGFIIAIICSQSHRRSLVLARPAWPRRAICLLHPKHLGGYCFMLFVVAVCFFRLAIFRAFNRRQSQILWGFLFMASDVVVGSSQAKVKFFVDYFFVISCGGFCPNCRDAAEVLCHCSRSWVCVCVCGAGGRGCNSWHCVCERSSEAEFIDIWKVKLAESNMNLNGDVDVLVDMAVNTCGLHAETCMCMCSCADATFIFVFN